MKSFILFLFFSIPAYAKYNCQGLDTTLNQLVQKINKNCKSVNDCRLDVLDWSACGHPIAHNDKDLATHIVEVRTQLHKTCGYIVAPCPAITSRAFCLSQKCLTREELLKQNVSIKVYIKRNNQALKNLQVILDVDNGIRCGQAPCPSRTVVANYQTNSEGMFEIQLNKFGEESPETNSLEDMRLSDNENHYYQLNLMYFLATKQPPYVINISW